MLSHVVGPALVHRHAACGWTVTTVEYPGGVAEIRPRTRLTQVVVSDRTGSGGGVAGGCYAAAACTHDGELVVAVRAAPPAIVVTPGGCSTAPADGRPWDSRFPVLGERLVLLSADALEAAPDLLAEGVRSGTGALAGDDPESLLLALVGAGGRGAGAVIDTTP